MSKYFKVEESVYNPNKYMIQMNHDMLLLGIVKGSCHVIEARVLGLDYVDYLRLCRDTYGAEIIGKGHKYPVAYFMDKNKAEELATILNKYTSTILKHKSKKVDITEKNFT